jgi:carbon starvation protein
MSLLSIVALSAALLSVAYFTYGRFLSRFLQLDNQRPTPAVELRDDLDYIPTEKKFLLGQHFSAIAAAGPIVGPILAGVMFGWLPALVWILIGAIFIGGVHDLTSLAASIRHKARSIAEIVREHMSQRSYVLFLLFIWIALVYGAADHHGALAPLHPAVARMGDRDLLAPGGRGHLGRPENSARPGGDAECF